MAKGKKYAGRVKGVPNKVTADARAAIALFVDSNADRLQAWLDAIAAGVTIEQEDGTVQVVTAPSPVRAFELFMSVVEYHVPKLARTELTGEGGKPLEVTIVRYSPPQ